jgi:pyruvate kinase
VSSDLAELAAEVAALRDDLVAAHTLRHAEIADTHPTHRRSAENLIHYVELRRHDLRDLQAKLARRGLSSLGRCEANVLATIEAVHGVLLSLVHIEPPPDTASVAMGEGDVLLQRNATALLGPAPPHRSTRIMVTLPSEAAYDPSLVAELAASGMDVARINCAHDGPDQWRAMISHLRSTDRPLVPMVRTAMDLGGPKLRTGPMQLGPSALRIAPERDALGRVTQPALVWLSAIGAAVPDDIASTRVGVVPLVDATFLERREPNDRLELIDSRGAQRHWTVVRCATGGCLATAEQTTYITTGLEISHRDLGTNQVSSTAAGQLARVQQFHRVRLGDHVVLTRSLEPALGTPSGTTHRIGCTLAEAFAAVRPTETVWLDDAKMGGVVNAVTADEISITITTIGPRGANLRAGKGINFPDSNLRLGALTAKDLADLPVVVRHADMVNLSFVRRPEDVAKLQSELERLDAAHIGIVLKIENAMAFANLPELLLRAMHSEHVGVMIARGDLAVEVGFERLAEVQEEILWACEAAHVPVIWATQVLDTLARTGLASRAEVTDAAMADRAECVMLNKGQTSPRQSAPWTPSCAGCEAIKTRSAVCCGG